MTDNVDNYIKNRVDQYISWYDSKAVKMKSYYMNLRIVSAVSAVLIPIINNINIELSVCVIHISSSALVTVLGALVAILIALEGVLRHREQWKNYRTTEQYLQTQKQLFVHKVGDYLKIDEAAAFKLFVNRIERAIAEENAITLNVLTKVESDPKLI